MLQAGHNQKDGFMDICIRCKGNISWSEHEYHFPDVEWLVIDEVKVGVCDNCGETYRALESQERLHGWIAREIVLNRQIGPKEIRFLRLFMGAKNAWAFATMLGTQSRLISSWEGGIKPSTHIVQRVRELIRSRHPELFISETDESDEVKAGKVHIIYSSEFGYYLRVMQPF